MASIQNDQDLKRLLDSLSPREQRRLGGMFIQSALDLCDDARIRRAVLVAMDPETSDDILEDAFRSAKDYAVGTYTECGRDTDWGRQAAHFIGVATACLLAADQRGDEGNRAWRVAMQVRNARNCASIAQGENGNGEDEAEKQRLIAAELMGA
jgi:hypothetical protein